MFLSFRLWHNQPLSRARRGSCWHEECGCTHPNDRYVVVSESGGDDVAVPSSCRARRGSHKNPDLHPLLRLLLNRRADPPFERRRLAIDWAIVSFRSSDRGRHQENCGERGLAPVPLVVPGQRDSTTCIDRSRWICLRRTRFRVVWRSRRAARPNLALHRSERRFPGADHRARW